MKIDLSLNKRGITLIELLIAFVILAITVAAIYRIFITQTRAYTVQDQVVDVQQNIRSAMEIMLRDLRMAQFHYNSPTSNLLNLGNPANILDHPLQITPLTNALTVEYEYYNAGPSLVSQRHRVDYDLNGIDLRRTLTTDGVAVGQPEILLGNVQALSFTCGTDGVLEEYSTQDGVVDAWVLCGMLPLVPKVIAIRVSLTARPEQELVNPDLATISPRTLTSTVVLKSCPEKNVKGTFVGMRFVLRKAMLMNKRDSKFSKNESGAALVIALIMMIVLTLIGLASTFTSTFEIILSGEKKRSTDAFYDCERNLDQVLMVPVNFIPGESKAVEHVNIAFDSEKKGPPPGYTIIDLDFAYFWSRSTGTDSTGLAIQSVCNCDQNVVRVIPVDEAVTEFVVVP